MHRPHPEGAQRRPTAVGARRALRAALALTTFGTLLVAAPAVSLADPPVNPSDGQLSAAQAKKNSLADRVGALSGQIAQMQNKLQQLQGQQELAEQKYAYAYSQLQDAIVQVKQSKAKVAAANEASASAEHDLVRYLQATYESPTLGGGTAETLLTATDPDALLEQGAIQNYAALNQVDAIGAMQRATIARSNAEAAARRAQQRQQQLTEQAKQAQLAAKQAVDAARSQQAELQTTLAASQSALSQAQSQLADLNNQRAQYEAYVAEQRRIAAEKARQERLARERAQRIAEEQRRRQQQQQQQQHQGGGGGGGSSSGGGGGGGGGVPIAPSGGGWTSGEAQTAVNRAMSTLGWPYAWAGGNASGPTYGVCDPSNDAPNDCHVYGYDCSGLAMYAWGPYLSMPHYAASQYVMAGSYHPGAGDLRPGDLVFWSSDGTIGGIHHVALYIGGQQIIEAPYSGAWVRTASLYEYGDFFGATRPLS
ncbi:MAG: NlpC/P60 family protein [Jatrophihabitans sp.]|uniref:C40 family peptidase n=1 Tax=Jatrophihabitans sp. TaxID=1932789 RepID=UPI003F7F63B2